MKKYDWKSEFGQMLTDFETASNEFACVERYVEDLDRDMNQIEKEEYKRLHNDYELAKKNLLNYLGYEYEIDEEQEQG